MNYSGDSVLPFDVEDGREAGVKALFMSGYDDNIFSSADLRDKGAFIQKPVMPTDLLRKVREVLDG